MKKTMVLVFMLITICSINLSAQNTTQDEMDINEYN